MGKLIDLTGQRFGRLVVAGRANNDNQGKPQWQCQCDCGQFVIVRGEKLRYGLTQSCGCLHNEQLGERRLTHGGRRTRLYTIWNDMKQRCYNVRATNYKNYGGRGIRVCAEWRDDFGAFQQWALSHGYADDLSIDRIDNDKGYAPDNCRWATDYEQAHNKRKK